MGWTSQYSYSMAFLLLLETNSWNFADSENFIEDPRIGSSLFLPLNIHSCDIQVLGCHLIRTVTVEAV